MVMGGVLLLLCLFCPALLGFLISSVAVIAATYAVYMILGGIFS
jgi:hypothetical protein